MLLGVGVFLSWVTMASAVFFNMPFLPTPSERFENFSHPVGCGTLNPLSARVVGGKRTTMESWPWIVSLRILPNSMYCAGSLLTSRHILTAAHCVERIRKLMFLMFVVAGGESIFRGQRAYVQNAILHPDFGKKFVFYADVAILVLKGDFRFDLKTYPVCLPPPTWKQKNGKSSFVIGWGRLAENGIPAWYLREASLDILKVSRCEKLYGFELEGVICAGAPGKDACQGDSGGPLLMKDEQDRWIQIGVVSHGIGCARKNTPAVYTDVSFFLDFINDVIYDNKLMNL